MTEITINKEFAMKLVGLKATLSHKHGEDDFDVTLIFKEISDEGLEEVFGIEDENPR